MATVRRITPDALDSLSWRTVREAHPVPIRLSADYAHVTTAGAEAAWALVGPRFAI